MLSIFRFRTKKDVGIFTIYVIVFAVILALIPYYFLMSPEIFDAYWRMGVMLAIMGAAPLSLLTGLKLHQISLLRDELRERLAHDALTGAKTRSELRDREPFLTSRPGIVVMMDLDHFKQVNDAHGHAIGDTVLFDLVTALRDLCRPQDDVYRVGGEELLMFFDDANADLGLAITERVREAVSKLSWRVDSSQELTVTLSGGWSYKLPDEPLSEHIKLADGALYRAKRAGRDRFYRATDSAQHYQEGYVSGPPQGQDASLRGAPDEPHGSHSDQLHEAPEAGQSRFGTRG